MNQQKPYSDTTTITAVSSWLLYKFCICICTLKHNNYFPNTQSPPGRWQHKALSPLPDVQYNRFDMPSNLNKFWIVHMFFTGMEVSN